MESPIFYMLGKTSHMEKRKFIKKKTSRFPHPNRWNGYHIVLYCHNEMKNKLTKEASKYVKKKTVEGGPREFVQFQSKKVKNMYARKSV